MYLLNIQFLLCDGIYSHSGPPLNGFINHPLDHKKQALKYFIPKTIKLRPEYTHLIPYLNNTHSLYLQKTATHPRIQQSI
jgi:hypothetical protein